MIKRYSKHYQNRRLSIISGILLCIYLGLSIVINFKENDYFSWWIVVSALPYIVLPIGMILNNRILSAIAIGGELIIRVYLIFFVYGVSLFSEMIMSSKLSSLLYIGLFISILVNLFLHSRFSMIINYLCILFLLATIVVYIINAISWHYESLDIVSSLTLYSGLVFSVLSYCDKLVLPKRQIAKKHTETTNDYNVYHTAEKLRDYHELLNKGIITEEEFEKKKDELL